MEQIIPILIAAVIFGFQAYANYQKEQEKAKKRNLGKPPVEEFPEFEPYEEVVVSDDPRSRHTRQSNPAPNPYARYEGALQNARSRRSTVKTDVIPEVKLAELDEAVQSPFDAEEEFDLRKAVIASAILERPYKD
ncbi:MAG TPA: hypothetical protein VFD72_00735 [Sphingobacteriaceae bacterium]|nr:hypothetical protein [Sphingobacteriaceae bacterium]